VNRFEICWRGALSNPNASVLRGAGELRLAGGRVILTVEVIDDARLAGLLAGGGSVGWSC
jgi:hypothetical protein